MRTLTVKHIDCRVSVKTNTQTYRLSWTDKKETGEEADRQRQTGLVETYSEVWRPCAEPLGSGDPVLVPRVSQLLSHLVLTDSKRLPCVLMAASVSPSCNCH